MASIANRSPWVVMVGNKELAKFRLKSQATKYLEDNPNPKAKIVQLETAFEIQIKLKDKEGNVIKLTNTCPTYKEAEAWAKKEEERLLEHKKQHGGKFDTSQETMTLEEGLNLLLEQHYKKMASYSENKYRIPHIVEYFGKHKLIKDITKKNVKDYRDYLEEKGYALSTQKNNFALLSMLFKHANSEWLFSLTNPVLGVKIDTPKNAVERYWESKDEKEKLLAAIEKYRPSIKNVVLLCLDLTFRIGEVLPKAMHDKHGNEINQDKGLFWKNVDFENNEIRLTHEKNDHTKRNT
ncbi:MAG TPA: phage integrase SAM-like domain-containing protein, partial [Rhodocyclaceae bacterium]|nr:phage integrase SAM-like domain-containing protein [Rhodocyclaceae bacterium]